MSHRLFSESWSLVLILTAAGCGSSEQLPLTGHVSLQFERMSPSGIHFRLANQTSEAIFFRGTYDSDSGADPWDVLMACRSPGSDIWQQGPFSLVDGGPDAVAVSPGEQVDVVVRHDLVVPDEPLERYEGGRCRVSVRLTGGSFIKSDEFEP
jgi:hypothetical protein